VVWQTVTREACCVANVLNLLPLLSRESRLLCCPVCSVCNAHSAATTGVTTRLMSHLAWLLSSSSQSRCALHGSVTFTHCQCTPPATHTQWHGSCQSKLHQQQLRSSTQIPQTAPTPCPVGDQGRPITTVAVATSRPSQSPVERTREWHHGPHIVPGAPAGGAHSVARAAQPIQHKLS